MDSQRVIFSYSFSSPHIQKSESDILNIILVNYAYTSERSGNI